MRQVAVSLPKIFLCVMADECLPRIVFTYVHGCVAKVRSSARACIVLVEDTNSSNEMDDVIRAELPHAHEDPVLHDLVKRHMLHGPCGALNPNAPCMKQKFCYYEQVVAVAHDHP